MIREAVILAGGFGRRLQPVVKDRPKPMALIRGRPFVAWLLDQLKACGVTRVIMAVGYMHEVISNHFGSHFEEIEIAYSVETEPLGTGGGLSLALQQARTGDVLVLNGDSYFGIQLGAFAAQHLAHRTMTLALHRVHQADRFGVVELDGDGRIRRFAEKSPQARGLINAGIYGLNREWLATHTLPRAYSLERDFLERIVADTPIYGVPMDGDFIDIGIPADYERAAQLLPPPSQSDSSK